MITQKRYENDTNTRSHMQLEIQTFLEQFLHFFLIAPHALCSKAMLRRAVQQGYVEMLELRAFCRLLRAELAVGTCRKKRDHPKQSLAD